MKRTIRSALVCACVLVYSNLTLATDRYVATTGSDGGTCTVTTTSGTNNCSSSGSPCASICQCISNMVDGDTCYVASGTYTDPVGKSLNNIPNCSTSGCTVKSTVNNGAILEFTVSPPSPWWTANNDGNWTWDGFVLDIQDAGQIFRGLNTLGAGKSLTIKNMYGTWKHDGTGPTMLYVTDYDTVTLENNYWHPDVVCQDTCGGSTGQCDFEATNEAVFVSADKVTTLTYTRNDFGHMRNSTTNDDVWTLTITRNKCSNPTNHGCFTIRDVQTVLAENNILQVTTEAACTNDEMSGGLLDIYCSDSVVMRNNTMVGRGIGHRTSIGDYCTSAQLNASTCINDSTGPNVMSRLTSSAVHENWKIYNNIFYDMSTVTADMVSNIAVCQISGTSPFFRSDYNMVILPADAFLQYTTLLDSAGTTYTYTTFAGLQTANVDGDAYTEDAHSINAAPDFTNYATGDFTPSSGSANMVDAGRNTGTFEGIAYECPSVDYAGNPRDDGNCDIGAYEYQAGSPPASSRRRAHITVPK